VVVSGQAVLGAAPDSAVLTLVVEAQDRRRDGALTLLAQRQRALGDLLDEQGPTVGERSTESVWVHPVHPGDGSDRVVGHVASLSTRVRIDDVEQVAGVLMAAAALPGVSVHGPEWQLRPSAPVHDDARALAVRDALARARGYATALGCVLTGLVEVRDAGTAGPPVQAMRAMAAESGAPGLDVEPGRLQVYGQVEMTFTMSEPAPDALLR
jgi:hypothetical protein